jgi:hypothetical protein
VGVVHPEREVENVVASFASAPHHRDRGWYRDLEVLVPASDRSLDRRDREPNRPEFVDFWTMRLADLLLISGKRGGETATRAYHQWLREQVARNTPFDQLARALLTATGEVASVGPANFFTLASDPRDLAEHVGRIFLGTQIACARCHAHPADRWTQPTWA